MKLWTIVVTGSTGFVENLCRQVGAHWKVLRENSYRYGVGLLAKFTDYFMNSCHFYPILYAILCQSLMEFMLFQETLS